MEVILLERVGRLGQMGDVVRVQRRLCPQLPAAAGQGAARHRGQPRSASRASAPSSRRATSSASTRPRRVAGKLDGKSFIVIRQAGETGQLYGSVSTRDIAEPSKPAASVERNQVALNQPIKTIGLHTVLIALHPGGRCQDHRQCRPQRRRGRAPGPGEDLTGLGLGPRGGPRTAAEAPFAEATEAPSRRTNVDRSIAAGCRTADWRQYSPRGKAGPCPSTSRSGGWARCSFCERGCHADELASGVRP